MRGHADSIALKLACHDPNVHRKLMPGGQQARARVRGGRAGARRGDRLAPHGGRRENLTAMLDDKFHRGKFDEITDRADAPHRGSARDDGARAA